MVVAKFRGPGRRWSRRSVLGAQSASVNHQGGLIMAVSLKPLDQQVIVITGASSGIGLATAEAAAREGAKLVLASRSGQTLDEVCQRIRANGGQAIYVVADVG